LSRWRLLARIAAGALACLLAAALIAAVPGSIEVADGPLAERAADDPEWTLPCHGGMPRPDRELLNPCARVRGRIVLVQHEPGEIHLAVLARLHLFVVKLAPAIRAPSLGSMVTVTGPLVRARNGFREVQAFEVGAA
jgi:hypothetical protein